MVLFCFLFFFELFSNELSYTYTFFLFLLSAIPILEIFALIRRATWSTTISE